MANYGLVKVAAACPKIQVANPVFNIEQIEKLLLEAERNDAAIVIFPELCVTGYTCGDLFFQKRLLDASADSLALLLENTKGTSILSVIGMPLPINQKLYNCAVAIQNGQVLGVVPKMYPPVYKEFYEKRWFSSGCKISDQIEEINLLGREVPFGNLIFQSRELNYSLGIEICEDLWVTIPPSSYMTLNGANIIANLSASNELVSKSDYRKQLVAQQSARCISGYIYSSAGVHESTTDLVFGGDCIIAENGKIIYSCERFYRDSIIHYSSIDVDHLVAERLWNKSFADNSMYGVESKKFKTVQIRYPKAFHVHEGNLCRDIPVRPFVPDNPATRDERCQEIFNIQVAGLAKRLEHTGLQKAVIGVSGGLDSTLALLITAKTFNLLGLDPKNILAVTMPGFGTTGQTYENALQLMQSLEVSIKEIDIKPACLRHFADIGHDMNIHDITYENCQARERTQILMDLANKVGGLVIGTGDLSELALGWCTYNGDHMSMYSVNCSIPKTLIKFLVGWVADNVADSRARDVLYSIMNTPISPELLPPDAAGKIQQKTEDAIGPYELHDFFLYYAIKYGAPPEKVLFLAGIAFSDRYSRDEIKKWLKVFYKRFFGQQYKRSCLPDGPKVGTISLSPRGDWRMPSDAQVRIWLDSL